jgi:O-antigen/teichoic acid export membrane protein
MWATSTQQRTKTADDCGANRLNFGSRTRQLRLSPESWVTLQVLYTQVFGVAVFAVLAPLLSPRAFGLVAIVMVFVTFCEATLDAATEALISIEAIDPAHYSTVTAVAVLGGVTFAIVLQIAAAPLASWFNEPQLEPVVRVMAILPLLNGLSAAPSAATKRAVAFRPLALRMICGVTAGGAVGLALALLNEGVWALVAQAIVQRGVATSILWVSSPLSFRIALSPGHWRDISAFARPLALSKSLSWAGSQLPRFVLAVHLSVAELGLFSLAMRLTDIVTSLTVVPKTAVARVELRQFVRASPDLIHATSQLMAKLASLCFPLCCLGAALLPQLVHAWLRPQWFGLVLPGQWLLLSTGSSVVFYAATALFLATRQQHIEALVSSFQVVTIVLATVCFGAHGLTVAAAALAIRACLMVVPVSVLVKKCCGVPYDAFLGSQALALAAAILVAVPVGLTARFAEPRIGSLPTLIGCGMAGLLLYGWLLRCAPKIKLSAA